MSTNYYRIPKPEEILRKQQQLTKEAAMLSSCNNLNAVNNDFRRVCLWDQFRADIRVHLGKRSCGWKFRWNFHLDESNPYLAPLGIMRGKYYNNKDGLLAFIRDGIIIDSYGKVQDTEEFIQMALNWCQPDGQEVDLNYCMQHNIPPFYGDITIDGLRVSTSSSFS